MNKFFLLILFFCYSVAHGQSSTQHLFDLKQLPATATNQWKFHAGDKPAWADTALDDHSWQNLDPTKLMHFLPQVRNAPIGWFRLVLNVAPALRGKAVSLTVNQFGAAEVYFNGILIRTMGKIGTRNKKEW
ncbi:MAG: hypothetical protein ACREGF_05055, partial [Candidatus Saccharimonadales bacterium]